MSERDPLTGVKMLLDCIERGLRISGKPAVMMAVGREECIGQDDAADLRAMIREVEESRRAKR